MTKERLFKLPYARELLAIAQNDLLAAKALSANQQVRYETAFFMLQQSVEKALKAVLVAQSQPVPLVRDLAVIIDRLDPKPNASDELNELTDFAAVRRYEEGTFLVTAEETAAAISVTATQQGRNGRRPCNQGLVMCVR